MERFLDNTRVQSLVKEAETIGQSRKVFSDTRDNQGFQYVDLVQEGGGVLGIGLVGYTYILEKAGIRFYSLAGTSAGSINTLLMAALGPVGSPVSEKILEALSEKDLSEFMDGNAKINSLIQRAIKGKGGLFWGITWNIRRIINTLKDHQGVNPGDNFHRWVTALLAQNGIATLADLKEHRKALPDFEDPENVTNPKLAIVASEISTHTKVDFPRIAELYWDQVNLVSPADFVRASMSVPYFFYPYHRQKNIPNAGEKENQHWIDLAGYHGPVPKEVRFVDGGMLSNFPIDIFHREDAVPNRPTFGVRLSTYRESYSKTDSFFGMSGAMISTMRQIHDYDFILNNPDYRQLICNIEADQDFNWLNFEMTDERQVDLFTLGSERAVKFLKSFDWEHYKQTRRQLMEVK